MLPACLHGMAAKHSNSSSGILVIDGELLSLPSRISSTPCLKTCRSSSSSTPAHVSLRSYPLRYERVFLRRR